MAEVTTNFRDSNQGDLGKNLVSKEYLISVYPKLASSILDPQIWCWGGQGIVGYNLGLLTKDNSFDRRTPIPFEPNSQTSGWDTVAAGFGLKKDGTLWGWGSNYSGTLGTNDIIFRSTPVREATSSTNWKKISLLCGTHRAAIKTDGSLWLWGDNTHGALGNNTAGIPFLFGDTFTNRRRNSSPVREATSSTNWKDVACATTSHTLALKTDGSLWSTGNNFCGQLGIGSADARSSFVRVGTANDWKKITCFAPSSSFPPGSLDGSSAGLKTDGSLWVWGKNYFNRYNISGASTFSITPRQIFTGVSVPLVINGTNDTFSGNCFISNTGILYTWGANYSGAVGNNTISNRYVASPVREATSSTNWKQVCGGNIRNGKFAGIKTDGSLWVWGLATNGFLGLNQSAATTSADNRYLFSRSSPTREFTSTTNWKQVSLFGDTVMAIKNNGELWGWGQNNNGQLGVNDRITRSTPIRIGVETSWNILSSGIGGLSVYAIKTNGTLWSWGSNSVGKLGVNDTISRSTPVQEFSSSTNWIFVAHGADHVAAIKSDGTLWSWGENIRGALGINVNSSGGTGRFTPVQEFTSSTNWVHCAAGGSNTAAIKSDGSLWCTGSNYYGDLGIGRNIFNSTGTITTGNAADCSTTFVREFTSSTNWKMVFRNNASGFGTIVSSLDDVGPFYALKTDGTLWSWGSNFHYGMGFDGRSFLYSPIREGTLSTWKDISFSGGGSGLFGIKNDGILWNFRPRLWGFPEWGSWAKLSISGSNDENIHFIKTDGTLWSIGNNQFGSGGWNTATSSDTPRQEWTSSTNWKSVNSASRCVFAKQSLITP